MDLRSTSLAAVAVFALALGTSSTPPAPAAKPPSPLPPHVGSSFDTAERNRGPDPQPLPPPIVETPEPPLAPGELLSKFRGRIKARASTFWSGWPPENACDGDSATSWFSAAKDAAALGAKPWLEVELPEDVTVQSVLVQGNREPNWPSGYSIALADVELYDAQGKLLAKQRNETGNPVFDIPFKFKKKVSKVRRLRFVSVADQGDKNPYQDIAIGELRAW